MFIFDNAERVDLARGTAFRVQNPVECRDFNHLVGQAVMINGEQYTVRSVERFAHAAPWRAGEDIALWIDQDTST
jgi:hypothetical protein